MLISETHVVGVAVYAKNQKENMPADEIVDLLEEAASDRP